jgi:hypothetical protein
MNREEQERLYNQKYGYQPTVEPSLPRSRFTLAGEPGAWEIIDGITVVDRFVNRGHALVALRGYVSGRTNRRARYSFRKVYRYLQANGWQMELNEPPAVWWRHKLGMRVKENRQLGARAFLLSFAERFTDTAQAIDQRNLLIDYWTWHKTHATT